MTNQSSEVPWTPGPWRLDDVSHAHVIDDDYHVIDAGGYNADTDKLEGFSLAGIMSPADAALIAESPAMAALLERANTSTGCHTVMWQQEVKALLSRIKGKAQ